MAETTYNIVKLGAFLLLALVLLSCNIMSGTKHSTLRVVEHVDLDRYTGLWYEIARYPNRFQENCIGSRATYTFRDDGKIDVLNECFEDSPGGKLRSAHGKAWVVDPATNAKLKVSFFWPFRGDYWIIDLGENYEYAVIGHPQRKYLWILGRDRTMDDEVYRGILERLKQQDYDTTRLIRTSQEKGI